MKKLIDIIEYLRKLDLLVEASDDEIQINHISYDSRDLKENTLFFCKGAHFKLEYLTNSLDKGVVAYISEIKYDIDLPFVLVKDIRLAMMEVGKLFYDFPDRHLKIITVTGTKGKSSTINYIKSIIDRDQASKGKKPCGILSTIYTYDGIEEFESTLTTTEAISLYKHLKNAVDSGLEYMVIEASSQGLKYNRINNLEADYGIFLNIGQDHVSPTEHPSFEDYYESKLKIFNIADKGIFNKEMDEDGSISALLKNLGKEAMTFAQDDDKANIYAKNIRLEDGKLQFETNLDKTYALKQLASYNVENALAAIILAQDLEIPYENIFEGLLNAQIEGREDIFVSDDKQVVAFVSYAHNGISFSKCFDFIKDFYPGYKIVSLFGAGGDRAYIRLKEMSEIAGEKSDHIYIIPDDPGYRPYKDIVADMAKIIEDKGCKWDAFELREEGIKEAFSKLDGKTLLFIAGKGGEKYNYYEGVYRPIRDDLTVTKEELEKYNNKK